MSKYYIEWVYLSTNYKGKGQKILSYDIGKSWVDYLNNKYKGVIHHELKR